MGEVTKVVILLGGPQKGLLFVTDVSFALH